MRYVHVEIDPAVERGKVRVGGVRIVAPTAEALWRGLQTTMVGVHDEDEADRVRELVDADTELVLLALDELEDPPTPGDVEAARLQREGRWH